MKFAHQLCYFKGVLFQCYKIGECLWKSIKNRFNQYTLYDESYDLMH